MNCTRRDFVSGVGAIAVVASSSLATSVTLATDKKEKNIRYAMVHDETSCIGCTACMDACRTTNKVPEGVSRLEIIRSEPYGEFPNVEYEFFRRSCQHCTNAPCVAVCPTGASFVDPNTGIVDVDSDLCVGCQYCIAVCPYRVRFIHPEKKSADKCNFCRDTNLAEGKQPACVEACPTKALTFGDMNDSNSAVFQKVKNNPVYRTKVALGTEPNLYHIPFGKGEHR
ncbi:cytochrome c nitrite reductase Fe-S protein [[Haemophilus] ducreyi]|uniref:cytochrome c nitrite reductase Fe-S protein n=1 Tax=Haemophilus ducreyi TaxID=730 RepID=UPI0006563F5E|nr:cytochrome c nitrite reductase Fe-S protein [[Haemophilus] ducreyi]AKO44943.1 nitrite reductase [[Haemophilus] ducreyi]AKO46347.1 nitrite reductase [[Haemophilus] ducreyi]AKO47692.1 nitrite reductase [[Haemophilus] ducreyi]AKO49073.1 nitrite reductase [[Haemophilus] ducreyi]ANF62095.1 cytochrome c nitrite reductase Fe-S protein [[Haemophilus] ducreyi]